MLGYLPMNLIQHHLEKISSTNDWAKNHLSNFEKNSRVWVTAQKQTQGRGQHGKVWYSPEYKNLYATLCTYKVSFTDPLLEVRNFAQKIAEFLEKHHVIPTFKWPNDLLVDHKKIAGILCETCPLDGGMWIIIGVGLNVNMDQKECMLIDQPATSLQIETGKTWDLKKVSDEILNYLT